jgi:hypothetical protein
MARAALYMAAVSAVQHNPAIKALYARKRSQGKQPMVALGHCMRKLAHIVYAMLRDNTAFDPHRHKRSQTAVSKDAQPSGPQKADGAAQHERPPEGSTCHDTVVAAALQGSEPARVQPRPAGARASQPPRQTERPDTQLCPPAT